MSVYVYSISERIGDGSGYVASGSTEPLCLCTAVPAQVPGRDYAGLALQWAPLLVYLLFEARHLASTLQRVGS